jgi:hypothetical protein
MTVLERISEYLVMGGLFNPELANHTAVRDLIIASRNHINELNAEIEKLKDLLNKGNESLMKENENLRWRCAILESYSTLIKEDLDLREKK